MSNEALAYFWGEDAYAIEQAGAAHARQLEADLGQRIEIWRTAADGDEGAGVAAARGRTLDEIEQRLTTSPLFGGGTLVVVRQPASLVAESSARQRLHALLAAVAPGNGLCFLDLLAAGSRTLAAPNAGLRDAVAAAGGLVREFPALTRDRMEAWIEARAAELDLRVGPGAARLLAQRVGAHVREGDIDRRRQAEVANAELEKLSLYRPGETVTREDVAELTSEAIPGSTWALLDAVGARRAGDAAGLAERLLHAGAPLALLIAQLHRRLRELIVVRDHLSAGTRPPELVRTMSMQPFRVQKLAEQAARWDAESLDAALAGLLDVDLLSKGIGRDGSARSISDDRSRLALLGWIGERVGRRGGSATRPPGVSVGA
ncbi:MAG: DNA polymerase III subunit delta [Chloroflexota bacterium]|nr:DNA polymerase III subunit delta [Chloroflexota bacterium]